MGEGKVGEGKNKVKNAMISKAYGSEIQGSLFHNI